MVDPSSSTTETTTSTMNSITLQLTKPFGIMLEEMDNTDNAGGGGGVIVQDVGDVGSAVQYADEIRGTQIIQINDMNVRTYNFDQMMDCIVQLPNDTNISIVFQKLKIPLPIGAPVTITVMTNNGPIIINNAKVGDNLRQTLIENNIEIYQGMQKLSNCGGAGQCTLCAFDFIRTEEEDKNKDDDDEWGVRSDYETSRLKKYPLARLTCLNTIQGPATIRKTQR
jgi:ferredoxin